MGNEDELRYSAVDDELISNLEFEGEWLEAQPTAESDEEGNPAQPLPLEKVDDLISVFRRRVDVADNVGDGIFSYLQEIAKTPLLTQAEEVKRFQQFEAATQRVEELFNQLPPLILEPVRQKSKRRRVSDSRYSGGRWWSPMEIATILEQIHEEIEAYQRGLATERAASDHPAGETQHLATLWKALNDVVQQMHAVRLKIVRANLLLVASVAKQYHFNGSPLSFLDLMQEGSIGLMKAVEKFDLRRGCRFSTYAHWWIRQAIQRALDQHSQTIRVPCYIGDIRKSLKALQIKLAMELEREPSLREIALAAEMDEVRVAGILQSAKGTTSLSSPLGPATDMAVSDWLADESQATPEDELLRLSEQEVIDAVLSTLSPREKLVIQLRYGLTDGRERSLAEIGPKLGVSRERVRQIQEEALGKLRHPTRTQYLKELL